MNDSTTTPDVRDRAWRADQAAARATDCGIPGCDRTMHDDGPEEWSHLVRTIASGALTVQVIVEPDGMTRAFAALNIESDSLDADGLRALVRQLTKSAAVLTSLSAELER